MLTTLEKGCRLFLDSFLEDLDTATKIGILQTSTLGFTDAIGCGSVLALSTVRRG